MTDLRAKIADIVKEVSPSIDLGADDSHSLLDLGLDSLDHATVLLQLEEAFEIKIPDEETEKLVSLASLVAFVAKNAKAA